MLLKEKIKKLYFEIFSSTDDWNLLYRLNKNSDWTPIKQPKGVFRADAFVIHENGRYFIFYEESKIRNHKGYICVGELNFKTNNLINEKIILEKDYHLSYPFVFYFSKPILYDSRISSKSNC